LRKLATLSASAGIAGLLLDRLPGERLLPRVQATGGSSGGALIIDASGADPNTGTGTTVLISPGNPAFISWAGL
jgi:hypothetical protein